MNGPPPGGTRRDRLSLVFIIDNFDSFTRNVAEGFIAAGADVVVRRADALDLVALGADLPDLLVISPGPGRPENASASLEAIRRFADTLPILGICLGHQCLAAAFGGRVERAAEPCHGKVSMIEHDGRGLFAGIPTPTEVGRYHSLAVTELPRDFVATAMTTDGTVMAMRHAQLPLAGLQFHPDSFLTREGRAMFWNALHAGL